MINNELIQQYSEMTYDERKFVLDSILSHKPKKILEVGIAAGTNSVIILDFLKNNGLLESTKLYSSDYNKIYYRDIENSNTSAPPPPLFWLPSRKACA